MRVGDEAVLLVNLPNSFLNPFVRVRVCAEFAVQFVEIIVIQVHHPFIIARSTDIHCIGYGSD